MKIVTRGGHDWSARFPLIAAAVRKLPAREAVIDGEACVVDEQGRPSFCALQAWLAGEGREQGDGRLAFATFDLLWLDGRDTRALPLEERRELLEALVKDAPAPNSFSRASLAATKRDFDAIVAAARTSGLEGIVAEAPRVAVRGRTERRLEEGEVRPPAGLRDRRLDPDGRRAAGPGGADPRGDGEGVILRHAGRVGNGVRREDARAHSSRGLAPLAVDAPPIHVPKTPGARWVRPALVSRGRVRRVDARRQLATFELRGHARGQDDRGVRGRERRHPGRARGGSRRDPPHSAKSVARLKLSNPSKVLFPRDGLTKRDILDYYMAVAPVLLPTSAIARSRSSAGPTASTARPGTSRNVPSPLARLRQE